MLDEKDVETVRNIVREEIDRFVKSIITIAFDEMQKARN